MNQLKTYSLRIVAGAFLLLTISSGFTQELILNFKFSTNQKLYFSESLGFAYFPLDSIEINNKEKVSFDITNKPTGYYKIHFNDTNIIDIIINNEPTIEITFHDSILQNGVEVNQSTENTLLWNYKYYSRNIQYVQNQIIVQRSYLNPLDSLYHSLTAKLDTLNNLKQLYLQKLANENPLSYFNSTVVAAQPPSPKPGKTQKQIHFDNIDFSDATLIRSTIFPGSIMEYLQKHTAYTEEGFQESIDYILALANQNQEVYEFCLNYLLEIFNLVGPDIIFDYLVENYLLDGGCSEINISSEFNEIKESYRILMPGNKAPEFTIKDTSRNEVSSLTFFGENSTFNIHQSTLFFFWSSQCGHCHEAIPELVKLKDNLNIVAISLDTNIDDWMSYIKEHQMPFNHFSELKGWDGEVHKKFKVHKTPSYFIINNKGVILNRPKDVNQVNKFVLGNEE